MTAGSMEWITAFLAFALFACVAGKPRLGKLYFDERNEKKWSDESECEDRETERSEATYESETYEWSVTSDSSDDYETGGLFSRDSDDCDESDYEVAHANWHHREQFGDSNEEHRLHHLRNEQNIHRIEGTHEYSEGNRNEYVNREPSIHRGDHYVHHHGPSKQPNELFFSKGHQIRG